MNGNGEVRRIFLSIWLSLAIFGLIMILAGNVAGLFLSLIGFVNALIEVIIISLTRKGLYAGILSIIAGLFAQINSALAIFIIVGILSGISAIIYGIMTYGMAGAICGIIGLLINSYTFI